MSHLYHGQKLMQILRMIDEIKEELKAGDIE